MLSVLALGAGLLTAGQATAKPNCDRPNPPPICDPVERIPAPLVWLAVSALGPGRDVVVRPGAAVPAVVLGANEPYRLVLSGMHLDRPTSVTLSTDETETCSIPGSDLATSVSPGLKPRPHR